MASISVEFNSDPQAMARLLSSTTGPYAQWLTRVGNQVVNSAKRKANVDTGLMRSRIEFRLDTEAGKLIGRVEAKTNYSFFVHNGTRGRPGNPFLTQALAEVLART